MRMARNLSSGKQSLLASVLGFGGKIATKLDAALSPLRGSDMHSDAIADLEMTAILQNSHLYPLGRKEFPESVEYPTVEPKFSVAP